MSPNEERIHTGNRMRDANLPNLPGCIAVRLAVWTRIAFGPVVSSDIRVHTKSLTATESATFELLAPCMMA